MRTGKRLSVPARYWWLRSPSHYYRYRALGVYRDGDADYGYDVNYDYYGVVPALNITL